MPNWVSNLLVLKPEDCKKIEEFLTERDGDVNLDFDKIIPRPDTLYTGPLGMDKETGRWCAVGLSWEEFKEKYPAGDWYNWHINNWGVKWNASSTYYTAPCEGDRYGTLEFQTPWDIPTPVMVELHTGKTVEFIHYYTEESNAFIGAMPYTPDVNYPEYLDDPTGNSRAEYIYRFVHGEGQHDWMLRYRDEFLGFFMDAIHPYLKKAAAMNRRQKDRPDFVLMLPKTHSSRLLELLDHALDKKWQVDERHIDETISLELEQYIADLQKAAAACDYIWVSNKDVKENPSEYEHAMVFTQRLHSIMKELRARALDMAVGLSRARANELIKQWAAMCKLEEMEDRLATSVTIDDVVGRRYLFGRLLASYRTEGLTSKLRELANLPISPKPTDVNRGLIRRGREEAISIIDTAKAMLELYDELYDMSSEEFMRMMQNYVRTNLFQLSIETVDYIDKDLLEEVKTMLRRVNVLQFKNLVHTGVRH